MTTRHRPMAGFTLVEVLVALAIVAVTLLAGLQATSSLTRNAERQADRLLAQLCAENALAQVRLSQQLPDVSDSTRPCEQAGRVLELRLLVQTTPNPNFRRVEARLARDGTPLLQLSTVVGRF
ncbi:type II secretion system minor pseudopilin GspI [Rhodoferax sp. TS-BS-61-7]|uniref:type II secretion system minor pseudopilin GspI n=1 Tax=Rhodoferax sp. TS-BS-61-7 TaxID=2094194 RepID=UPI000CF5F81C|nr:type II secretion system minor pseudopilin GspI [Rhodoferax sp. TS-BS-61-7]PQA77603.1 type II secretion system protein GspI [Rhodoferax sp. TS-BS-61-7]